MKGCGETRIGEFEFGGLLLDEPGLRALGGDVLVDADPAAARNRGLDDGDDPAVCEIVGRNAFAGLLQLAAEFIDEGADVEAAYAVLVGKLDDIVDVRALMHEARRHSIDLFVALVPHCQPALGVEHRKAARHVGQRRIEANVLP